MELGDAIKHAEAVAQTKEREAKENRNHGGWAYDDEATKCSACAAEHRQLAEWLKELKERREKDSNNELKSIQGAIRLIKLVRDIDPWAMKIAVEAMQKQIPKKLIAEGDGYADGSMVYDSFYCPSCDHRMEEDEVEDYCPNCGQKICWEEE